MAYERLHGVEQRERKKPLSQIEAEERREVENKKKKFKEFLSVMMAQGKKVKDQGWNESFNDFVPTDHTKSRRERKKEDKERREQKERERQEKLAEEDETADPVKMQKVVQDGTGMTIVEKEINRKSTKLGRSKAKQVHIKFGEKTDIDTALEKVEEEVEEEQPEEQPVKEDENEGEGDEIDENRLYVMNLPFTITENEVRDYFGQYGEIDEISIPLRRGGIGTGFCFVRYMEPEAAINAFANLDKKIFQGRIITILPASKKKENKKPEEFRQDNNF